MISFRAGYMLNYFIIFALIYSGMAYVLKDPSSIEIQQNVKVCFTGSNLAEDFQVDFLRKNAENVPQNNRIPWSKENNGFGIVQTHSKRNLEYLAKSSGGYMKNNQRNKDQDEKNASKLTELISSMSSKNKRGIHILAKNKDFPKKISKTVVKELSVSNYSYPQSFRLNK